jgi:hypothetical protein
MCTKLLRVSSIAAAIAVVLTVISGPSFASPFGGGAFSGFGHSAGFTRPSYGAAAPAAKSGTITCTSYGLCKPLICPRGKKSDGTCW